MTKKRSPTKAKKTAGKHTGVFIYAPDESLKKKLGIGKSLGKILTPATIKKVTRKTKNIAGKLLQHHEEKTLAHSPSTKKKPKKVR